MMSDELSIAYPPGLFQPEVGHVEDEAETMATKIPEEEARKTTKEITEGGTEVATHAESTEPVHSSKVGTDHSATAEKDSLGDSRETPLDSEQPKLNEGQNHDEPNGNDQEIKQERPAAQSTEHDEPSPHEATTVKAYTNHALTNASLVNATEPPVDEAQVHHADLTQERGNYPEHQRASTNSEKQGNGHKEQTPTNNVNSKAKESNAEEAQSDSHRTEESDRRHRKPSHKSSHDHDKSHHRHRRHRSASGRVENAERNASYERINPHRHDSHHSSTRFKESTAKPRPHHEHSRHSSSHFKPSGMSKHEGDAANLKHDKDSAHIPLALRLAMAVKGSIQGHSVHDSRPSSMPPRDRRPHQPHDSHHGFNEHTLSAFMHSPAHTHHHHKHERHHSASKNTGGKEEAKSSNLHGTEIEPEIGKEYLK